MDARGNWQDDDSIPADQIYVGLARDHDTQETIGVMIALKIKDFNGNAISVSATMPAEQATGVADAIAVAAMDLKMAKDVGP